jgi:hypothetical protein
MTLQVCRKDANTLWVIALAAQRDIYKLVWAQLLNNAYNWRRVGVGLSHLDEPEPHIMAELSKYYCNVCRLVGGDQLCNG